MDKLLKQCDRESVRTTMLKQEEIFKEHVHELHRLYVVQKMLMIEFKMNKSRGHSKNSPNPRTPVNPDHQPRVWDTRTVFETNNCSFTNTNNSGHNFHQLFSVRTEPINSPEQSGTSCSRYNVKMHKDFDLESPAKEFSRDIGRDQICSSSTTSSKGKMKVKSLNEQHFIGDLGIQLIIIRRSKRIINQFHRYLHTSHKHNMKMDSSFTSGNTNATFSQETLEKPPWYFRTLDYN
ncbi:hypothetical protein MKX01_027958 [Papaver californicum]|nr:hypothetical protein MKX01_027958 [Papaver californicum]